MNIEDIEIKIKKYDREKNHIIANLIFSNVVEVRGYVLRYTTTKYSRVNPVWVVTPPAQKGRNQKWFHVVRVTDSALWQQIQEKLVKLANEHANLL